MTTSTASSPVRTDWREHARKSLPYFIATVGRTDTQRPALPAPHHLQMLRAIEDDSLGNTVIIAPPGSAKTFLVSHACAWWLGLHPDRHIIYVSNSYDQAVKPAQAVRELISYSPQYHTIFPNVLADKERGWSNDHWFLRRPNISDKDTSFLACGINGPLLGARGDILILDDVADMQNMESDKLRDTCRRWIAQTAMSRLSPQGRAIMICTRWHEDDPADWAVKAGWHVLHIPAITDDGESYWPERWPMERLLAEKRSMGPHDFQRMYMGVISRESGAIFNRNWFRWYDKDHRPRFVTKVDSWDLAWRTGEQNAYSVCVTAGITEDGNFYLLNVLRHRWQFPDLARIIAYQQDRFQTHATVIENAASGVFVIDELRRLPGINVIPFKPTRDKEARARATSITVNAGRVYLPNDSTAGWVEPFLSEVIACPDNKYWDQIDAFTQLVEWGQSRSLHRPQVNVTVRRSA